MKRDGVDVLALEGRADEEPTPTEVRSPEDIARTRRRRAAQVVGALAVVGTLATMAAVGREVIGDAWSLMSAVSIGSWLALVALCAVWTTLRACVQRWSVSAVGWRTAFAMSEAGEAASFLPLGGLGSFAVRTAIGRTSGLTTSALVMAFILVSEALGTGLWILVVAAAAVDISRGTADSLDHVGLTLAAGGLALTAVSAWVIVSPNRVTNWLVRATVRLHARVARRRPRLAARNVASIIETARADGAALIRRRSAALVVAAGYAAG